MSRVMETSATPISGCVILLRELHPPPTCHPAPRSSSGKLTRTTLWQCPCSSSRAGPRGPSVTWSWPGSSSRRNISNSSNSSNRVQCSRSEVRGHSNPGEETRTQTASFCRLFSNAAIIVVCHAVGLLCVCGGRVRGHVRCQTSQLPLCFTGQRSLGRALCQCLY